MAVLSADVVGFSVDGESPALILPLRAAVADIFYRGGNAWDSATGIIVTDPGDAILWRGVVAERTTTLAANDRVRCYIFGHFLQPCTNFTIANEGAGFRGQGVDGDNPATMIITAPGADIGGRVGMLTTVETSGTDGWILCSPFAQD